jgi:periplasmic divalent cation tolerance protein
MTGQAQNAQGGDASFAEDLPFPGAAASAPAPPQAEFLQVQTTTDSRAEAVELARAAVAARLAACAQVAGPVASTYWWEGEMERAEEWLVMMKLPADRYADLAALLTRLHSYDEPEIIAMPISAGSAGYLGWIRDETRQPDTT